MRCAARPVGWWEWGGSGVTVGFEFLKVLSKFEGAAPCPTWSEGGDMADAGAAPKRKREGGEEEGTAATRPRDDAAAAGGVARAEAPEPEAKRVRLFKPSEL